jgi:tetratricopeptide (TPR) repeat protein
MAERAARLLAELRAGVNQAEQTLALARKHAQLLADLEAARMARSVVKGKYLDNAASAVAYAKAFAAYGLEVLGHPAAVTVPALRRLPARMREALVVALDDWAMCARNKAVRKRLREVAGAVDQDPWRRRFRRARDLATVMELAVEVRRKPLPAVSLDLLASALRSGGAQAQAVAIRRQAQQRYPADFWSNFELAAALREANEGSKQGLDEAIGYYRAAVALRPGNVAAHNNLGNALQEKGDLAGAIAEFKKVIALDPKAAPARYNLGNALKTQGDLAGAIAEYQKAIALDSKYAMARYNLGNALQEKGDVAGAIAEYQKAIALDSNHAEAHCNLGMGLGQQGRLQESLASLRRGHALGARRPGWPYPSAQWVKQAERLVELDQQLPAFLQAKRQPSDAAEALWLAMLCQQPFKQRYAAAVRFYRAAFAAEPKRAEDLRAGHRYNAARAAALAGCGQGKDAAALDAKERSGLRRQALTWLRADLAAWRNLLEKEPEQVQSSVRKTLRDWQRDSDLAGVRDRAALAKLPAAERQEWAKLWGEVAALLAKVGPKK